MKKIRKQLRPCPCGHPRQWSSSFCSFSSWFYFSRASLLWSVVCFLTTAVVVVVVVVGDERFAPLLPAQFDCKARVDIAYSSSSGVDSTEEGSRSRNQPMLLLLHADLDSGRVREDYYLLPVGSAGGTGSNSNSSPEKVYTIVRRFDEGRQYMAYYRVRGWKGHVPTPRACFITAVEGELPQRDFLRQSASYIDTLHFNLATDHRGVAVVLTPQGETSATSTTAEEAKNVRLGVNHTVFANVWRFELGGKLMQLIESTRTRLPVQLQMVRSLCSNGRRVNAGWMCGDLRRSEFTFNNVNPMILSICVIVYSLAAGPCQRDVFVVPSARRRKHAGWTWSTK